MSIRQKVRKVFHRQSSNAKAKESSGIKIEYYKRHEIPRSKFKGPFDPEHQRRLAAWSFQEAQADRPRSFDLSLSPCATVPDHMRSAPDNDDEALAPDAVLSDIPPEGDGSPREFADFDRDPEYGHHSSSSTAVDSDSYSSSLTLLPSFLRDDSIAQIKESIRHTSPAVHTISPPPLSPKGAYLPFSPEDLTRALNAVQICS
ncbi:predicted protein [Aspergillus terreus NIH2624]|uniref:Uncharacterized protein n=1 Tax=Aspergillus terreus (strain NIH 2624 / FGSC A1156) TaxID=341663 RepID=Q0CSD5_ASPTN|nr:uncharacterized protein ATEG_03399 [Aspergillus terreus NIH2624]EAU36673.1 predicted protein [Aspergillus terreus NIH2624]KAG2417969.1 hypothetical protein HFD88_001069 [Aspergillus terreus]